MAHTLQHVARIPSDAWDISSIAFRQAILEDAASAAHDARRIDHPCYHLLSVTREGDDVRIIAVCTDRHPYPRGGRTLNIPRTSRRRALWSSARAAALG